MSLRDFNTPASDDPIALHNEPLGNGEGLSTFHTVNVKESERSNTPQIVGAVAVALLVGAAAVGIYAYSGPSTKSVVANNSLPQTVPATPPAPPPQQTAMAPDNSTPPPAAAAPVTPAPASTTESAKPAPVRTASVHRSHIAAAGDMSSRTTTQTPEAAQTTPVPEQAQATPLPAAPTPSPSDVASNSSQSNAAVPNNAATASDMPQASTAPQQLQSSTPQVDNAAPAQNQQSGATPPPAQ